MASEMEREFDRLAERLRERVTLLFQGVVREATRRIAERTPVDTGHARGNWLVGRNGPGGGEVATSWRAPVAEVLHAAEPEIQALEFGDQAFITNAVPYIEGLEMGSSQQAPAGMVGITAAELQQITDQVAGALER